jgi:hypothetical protein
MICPHCHRTIREEQRYLMSRDPEADTPAWTAAAITLLVGLGVIATVAVFFAHAAG